MYVIANSGREACGANRQFSYCWSEPGRERVKGHIVVMLWIQCAETDGLLEKCRRNRRRGKTNTHGGVGDDSCVHGQG